MATTLILLFTPAPWLFWIVTACAGALALALIRLYWSTRTEQLNRYQKAIAEGLRIQEQLNATLDRLKESEDKLKEANRLLRAALRERDKEIADHKNEVDNLKRALAKQERANAKLNDVIGEQSGLIEKLRADVRSLQDEQGKLRAQLGLRDA